MSMDTDRCVKCSGETHDVDGKSRCHNCRPATVERVSLCVETDGETGTQYFAIDAVIAGQSRTVYETTRSEDHASDIMGQLMEGGPECPYCRNTMDVAEISILGVFWTCADENCEHFDEDQMTLDEVVEATDNENERVGQSAMERRLADV